MMLLGPAARAAGCDVFAYRAIATVTHDIAVDGRRRAMRVYARTQDGSEAGLALDDVYRDTTVPRLDDLGVPFA